MSDRKRRSATSHRASKRAKAVDRPSQRASKSKKGHDIDSTDDMATLVYSKDVHVILEGVVVASVAKAWDWIGRHEHQLPHSSQLLSRVECTSQGQISLTFSIPLAKPEYQRIRNEEEKVENPQAGPTTAVRVRGAAPFVSFVYHQARYTAPLRDREVVITGSELRHLRVETEGCEAEEFDVTDLTDNTFIFSTGADLTPCQAETDGQTEPSQGTSALPLDTLAELRKWPCTTRCKDEKGSEYLLVRLPDLKHWDRFVRLADAAGPTQLQLMINPALPLRRRRVLANVFRSCRNMGPDWQPKCDAPAPFFSPRGASLPGWVSYSYQSLAVFDRCFLHPSQNGHGSPLIGALAPGTSLGSITAMYEGGHAVHFPLKRMTIDNPPKPKTIVTKSH